MTEAQSVLPAGPENYSTQKVALEEVLLEGAKSPVAILRPCAIHGVGSVHPREWWLIKRMLDGRSAIPLAFAGQSRFHTTSVANIAAVVGILAEKPGTHVLNVGDRECLTLGQLARVLAEAVGYIGEFFEGDWGYPPVVGSTPWSVPAPFTIDSGAAMAVGYQPLGYAQTCLPVVEWLKAAHEQSGGKNPFPFFDRYPRDPFDYAAEDAFFARVGTRALA
jgi:nucleoside-diphosphate-sugar epimerase